MDPLLPVNIDHLLHQRGVEGSRVEFKASWNEGGVAEQVLQTICAFANDYLEGHGGYIVLGVEERSGVAVLPPKGLDRKNLTAIQRSIRGQCQRIEPRCKVIVSHEVVEGCDLLVIWVPTSEDRPHAAPVSRNSKERRTYIRLGAETVAADQSQLQDLIRRKGGKAPFDDRAAPAFVLEDLRSSLVREFLHDVRSGLLDEPDDLEIFRRMRLTAPLNGREVPRNVALMFFSDDPERAFPGARIEVVLFAQSGDVLDERVFHGPLHRQLRETVSYLDQRIGRRVEKVDGRAESETWSSYPFGAIEEAIGNAVHHRDYDRNPEPTKVYLYDDRMEITSYPGPVPGLEAEHFEAKASPPQVPGRNRRIGEFLKELRLVEMRGSGVRKIHRAMAENGSLPPRFEFDQGRTYFRVLLPIHPRAAQKAGTRGTIGGDGLVVVSLGGQSRWPIVEASLADLGLGVAKKLVDFAEPEYIDTDAESLQAAAKRLRNAVRGPIEDPEVVRLHLFYRGPLAMAPLLGAVLAGAAKPVVVYHYHEGRYTPAYVLDGRFLKAKD